ncbi:MAG TPA: response regulator [Polyangiales bacterium]|nr:response regulator [Polyangiales bacterium]
MQAELIVVEDSDDDFDALERTCRSLAFAGELKRYSDAETLLQEIRTWDTEPREAGKRRVILLDLNLPGVDGRELLVQLKTDTALSSVPVVVYTTSSNLRDIAFCYQNHANAYHVKPMDLAALESGIKAMLDYWFGLNELPRHT